MEIKLTKKPNTYVRWLLLTFMRSFIFLMCITVFGFSSKTVLSQNEKIVIDSDKMLSVDEVFDIISEQTELRFIYQIDMFKTYPKVKLQKGIVLANDLLSKAIPVSDFNFNYGNNTIFITKAEEQQNTVSGTVTDEDGNPLAGANVLVGKKDDKFKRGVVTDFDGKFTIRANKGDTIIFSYLGYETVEKVYNGEETLNVTLKEVQSQLEEVVISTGYQKIPKERSTGSATVLNNKQLESFKEQRTTDNILTLIEGAVPGLVTGGILGTNQNTITIRGNTQPDGFGRDYDDVVLNEPLIVVDGFPVSGVSSNPAGDLNTFEILNRYNPEDIESITVLKDAAAASIWGARAGNGVIVINTKRGRRSQTATVTASSSYSFQSAPDYTNGNFASVNSALELDRLAVDNFRQSNDSEFFIPSANSLGRQAYADLQNGLITQAEADAIINNLAQTNMIGEYSDLFLRTFSKQRLTTSLSQGGEAYSLYASFNFDKEDAVNVGNEARRFTGNLGMSTDIAKNLTFSGRVNYTNEKRLNNGVIGDLTNLPAYDRFLDAQGNYIFRPGIHRDTQQRLEAQGIYPYTWDYNLLQEQRNRDNTTRFNSIDIGATLEYEIFKGLKLEAAYNYQETTNATDNLLNENMFEVRNTVNSRALFSLQSNPNHDPTQPSWLPGNSEFVPTFDPSLQYGGFGIPTGNFLDQRESYFRSSNGRAQVNYAGFVDKQSKHYATFIAGVDYREVNSQNTRYPRLYGYNTRTLTSLPIDLVNSYIITNAGTFPRNLAFGNLTPQFVRVQDRFLATYANAAYTYDGKYTISGSSRLDDSNVFGSSPKYRNKSLWSVGAKWQIAKENFLKDNNTINQLDFRASFGTGGNINKSTNPFLTLSLFNDFQTGAAVANLRNLPNEELRWEETETINLGLDFTLFNRKLSGTFDWYRRYTSDLLVNAEIAPTNGYSQQLRNFGEVLNTGYELTLNYTPIATQDFRWNLIGILAYNKNRIERYDGFDTVQARANGARIEGDPIGGQYAYRWAGLSDTGAPQVFDQDGNIIDNNTRLEDVDALEYVGQVVPKHSGSLRNSISYKGFTLDALITYKLGHVFRRQSFRPSSALELGGSAPHIDFESRWQNPGDEATTDVPAFTPFGFGNYTDYYFQSNLLVEKADHIRLTNISLSYNLNSKWLENTFLKAVNLGFNVQNVGLLWTANDFNIDPEVGNGLGFVRDEPVYSFSARITF